MRRRAGSGAVLGVALLGVAVLGVVNVPVAVAAIAPVSLAVTLQESVAAPDLQVQPQLVPPGGTVAVGGDGWPDFASLEDVGATIERPGSLQGVAVAVSEPQVADGVLQARLTVPGEAAGLLEIRVCATGPVPDPIEPIDVPTTACASARVGALAPFRVTPDRALPGEPVVVEVGGLPPATAFQVALRRDEEGSAAVPVAEGTTDTEGRLQVELALPQEVVAGGVVLEVCRPAGARLVARQRCLPDSLVVTVREPEVRVEPPRVVAGDVVRVTGEGWCCEGRFVTVATDGREWGRLDIGSGNVLAGEVTAPADQPPGSVVLRVCTRAEEQCREVDVEVLPADPGDPSPTDTPAPTDTPVPSDSPSREACPVVVRDLRADPAEGAPEDRVRLTASTAVDGSVDADAASPCTFRVTLGGADVAGPLDVVPGGPVDVVLTVPAGLARGDTSIELVEPGVAFAAASTDFRVLGEGDTRPWLPWVLGAVAALALLAAWRLLRGRGAPTGPRPPEPTTPARPDTGLPPWAGMDVLPRLRLPAEVGPGGPVLAELRLETPDGDPIGFDTELDVQFVADGFTAQDGVVARLEPGAQQRVALPLRPDAVAESTPRRVVGWVSWAGHLVGWTEATLTVDPARTSSAAQPAPAVAAPLGTPDGPAPDLTVTITRGVPDEARLLWSMRSPHPVRRPDGEVRTVLTEADARTFAHGRVLKLGNANVAANADLLTMHLNGIAGEIGDGVPAAVWQMLREIVPVVGGTPTVLVVSDETWIPWELAALPGDLAASDQDAPAVLGARVALGRWIPPGRREGQDVAGPPSLPPRSRLDVGELAVVVDDSVEANLPFAVEEARYLQQHLGATVVSAGADTVAQLLSGRLGDGTQDLVHFACHGYVGTTDPSLTGLHVAVGPNGVVLTPHMLRAAPLLRARGPVLFANACDVGTPEQALDAFGGVVGGALRGGCRAVIAPMWKVDDEAASETAQELWARVLGRGEPLGDVLRARRARPADAWRRRDFLSYAYFGDPRLVLARVEGDLPVGVGSGGGTGPSGP